MISVPINQSHPPIEPCVYVHRICIAYMLCNCSFSCLFLEFCPSPLVFGSGPGASFGSREKSQGICSNKHHAPFWEGVEQNPSVCYPLYWTSWTWSTMRYMKKRQRSCSTRIENLAFKDIKEQSMHQQFLSEEWKLGLARPCCSWHAGSSVWFMYDANMRVYDPKDVWSKMHKPQAKKCNYFTSSDPHHDISKQPR